MSTQTWYWADPPRSSGSPWPHSSTFAGMWAAINGVITVASAYARAIAVGATPINEPVKRPWGQIVAYVRAKEGKPIELCSPMAG